MDAEANLWASLAGMLISATFRYFPKLKQRFAALEADRKRAFVLIVLAMVSLCLSFQKFYESATCPANSGGAACVVRLMFEFLRGWLVKFIWAAVISQATFLLLPKQVMDESK
jgi:hypothetical protein